jgi:hypothetical protein
LEIELTINVVDEEEMPAEQRSALDELENIFAEVVTDE